MPERIAAVTGEEILDSRGYPTLRVQLHLRSGQTTSAEVPAGASTGSAEARELRDQDAHRYSGRGVFKAIEGLNEISTLLLGKDPTHQAEIDRLLVTSDGTPEKSRLGANAIVGTSMAVARAGALVRNLPLYDHLAILTSRRIPVPMMNVINGGRHAANTLDFQEYMIVPHGAGSFREALRWGAETYHALHALLKERGLSTGVGDEGGFAPALDNNEMPCRLIVEAIERAGYIPGRQIGLALDPAASSFWEDGGYLLEKSGGARLDRASLGAIYADWSRKYPIVSIEDGFGEEDWDGFRRQTADLGATVQIVGDDLYVTNPKLIERGVRESTTNAVLIKLNQIGTVTESIQAVTMCIDAGWRYVVSHRSGETTDSFIADFAVAMGGGQIKAGAPCRGERVAKYNRLLEIERELGSRSVYVSPFIRRDRAATSSDNQEALSSTDAARNEIVAVIEEAPLVQATLTAAGRASRIGAPLSVTALHICVDPNRMVGAAEEYDIQRMRELSEGSAKVRRQRVLQEFEAWLAATGREDVRWVDHVGTVSGSLPEEVRKAALIVIAQPHNLDSADALYEAIFHSGRPVLFVPPQSATLSTFGRHVAIAWKPRPQARRAIDHAGPWLRAADRISVICVNERDVAHDADEVIRQLQALGCSADIRHVATSPGEHVCTRIVSEVTALGADSIVMGAYRFGQAIEWAFGGVTYEMLKSSRWPIFLKH